MTRRIRARRKVLSIMMRIAVLTLILGATFTTPAVAEDPGEGAWMIRVLACEGPDARMEIYVPQSVVSGTTPIARALMKPVIGYYALDLSDTNKGKPLEPVKVSMTPDGKTVIVNQYTRGLPPTRIPVGGGTVDFDRRFGTKAKCGPFQE
jgi:hypothetical protein